MLFKFLIVTSCFVISIASYGASVEAKLFNTVKSKTERSKVNQESSESDGGGYGVGKKERDENRGSQEDIKEQIQEDIKKLNMRSLSHIRSIRDACIPRWDGQGCMKSLSALNMETASFYAESLDASGRADSDSQLETLKEHCAASTAALKVDVPAYAMQSAMTECVNTISDIVDETTVKPDVSMYQLMVGAILCLGKDTKCNFIEGQLKAVP